MDDLDDPVGVLVTEHADGMIAGRQPADDVVGRLWCDLAGLGANTKPRASAPMATASKASSSLVIPQILTNMAE